MGKTIADRERVMKRALLAAGWMVLASAGRWPIPAGRQYGGDQGGQRHSAATQITPANVTGLRQAWSYSTGRDDPACRVVSQVGLREHAHPG